MFHWSDIDKKPKTPVPYSEECITGSKYATADNFTRFYLWGGKYRQLIFSESIPLGNGSHLDHKDKGRLARNNSRRK